MTSEGSSRMPIFYSLAYHSMAYNKDDPNFCAREFLEYFRKIGNILSKDLSSEINTSVARIEDDKTKRELMQAFNLELTIQGVEDLFPNLLKSKEISREEINVLLKKVTSSKIRSD